MKFRPTVTHPVQRSERLRTVSRHLGINDAQGMQILRIAMTPAPLLALPDHADRGHKSLGRIQQLTNRRRFKQRRAA